MENTIKNKKMILACLNYLIDNEREFTLNNLANYLSDHDEAMEYITEGDLPVNDNVIKAIKDRILTIGVSNIDNFKGIISIRTTFGYSRWRNTILYSVAFRRIEYFAEGSHFGSVVQDDTYTKPREVTAILQIHPSELNIKAKVIM